MTSKLTEKLSGKLSGNLANNLNAEGVATSTLIPWPSSLMKRWRENPQRLAWVVILFSFAIFLTLAITMAATQPMASMPLTPKTP